MTRNCFAYVIDPIEMGRLECLEMWGVLRERSGVREVSHFDRSEDMLAFVDGLAVIPSRDGERTALLPFGEEMLIISEIVDLAPRAVEIDAQEDDAVASVERHLNPDRDIDAIFAMPPVFSRVRDVSRDGVTLIPGEDGYDIEIDDATVRAIGWQVGDRVAFGLDGGATRLAISRVMEGTVLEKAADGGLETVTTVPFPSWILSNQNPEPVSPPIELHSEAIVMQVAALNTPSIEKPKTRGKAVRIMDGVLLFIAFAVFFRFVWDSL
jgi:hypothetical protein